MSIKDKQNINVLNYNDSTIAVSTREDSILIPCAEGGNPAKVPFSFAEIETINSKGKIFKSGYLRFEEDEQEEIYDALRITNWREILTDKEIEDTILNPSYEKLNKIVGITDIAPFERIRSAYVKLSNNENNDISSRVARVISQRYEELKNGQKQTEISISKNDKRNKNTNLESLEMKNEALQRRIADMEKQFAQLAAAQKVDREKVPPTSKRSSATKAEKPQG